MTPSTLSPPDGGKMPAVLPHVFVDRSLGAVQVPAILRSNGLVLTTMREHYGEQSGQRVADTAWIELTAARGWIGFHKDDKIRRNEVERLAVLSTGARMFCIPRADLTADEAAARYLNNMESIREAATMPGPFIYSVQLRTIERLV